jgi:hypothetical protein
VRLDLGRWFIVKRGCADGIGQAVGGAQRDRGTVTALRVRSAVSNTSP